MLRCVFSLIIFTCILGCGNDDQPSFNCQQDKITVLLNGTPFEYESITRGYASAVDLEVYKRAIEIMFTRADGESITILFSSIVDAFNNDCLAEK